MTPPADTSLRPRSPVGAWQLLRVAMIVALAGIVSTQAEDGTIPPEFSEFEVKAAALYHIVTFVNWPATAFSSPDAPLVIGLLGRGSVASVVEEVAITDSWNGRRIVLEHFTNVGAAARRCHVLYVERSFQNRWTRLRAQFARRPILTVSDAPEFARQGGVVQFVIDRKRLRLTVNLDAARTAGLEISSKVLRLADVIEERRE